MSASELISGTPRRARFVRAAAVLLLWAAAGCRQDAPVVRRPLAQHRLLDFVELGNVSFPAEALDEAEAWTLPLDRTPAGSVKLNVGSRAGSPATIEVALQAPALRETPSCKLTFPAGLPQWQECRLQIATPLERPDIVIRARGCGKDACYVSSPLLREQGKSDRPHIMVILVDTLRADRLKTYDPTIPLGDAIDTLAKDSIVFEQARSSTSWTRTAIASLFTGREPHMHRVESWFDLLPQDLSVLTESLQSSGYETYAWSTNYHVIPRWGFGRGFDRFEFVPAAVIKQKAREVLPRIRETLRRHDRSPSFFYIHLLDPHGPYMPYDHDLEAVSKQPKLLDTIPDPRRRGDPTAVDRYARYLAEIRGVDRELGAFFDELRRERWYDDTLIVLLSDHGEEFWDHGGVDHGWTLYEEVLRIPLIVKLPGSRRGGTRVSAAAAIEDLMPTILELAGAAVPPGIEGRSLAAELSGAAAPPRPPHLAGLKVPRGRIAALVDEEQRKFILDPAVRDQLFDLRSDPRERRDLADARPELAAIRRAEIENKLAAATSGWHILACQGLASETVRLEVRGAIQSVNRLGLEREDALRTAKGGASAILTLRLRPARESRAKLSERLSGAELKRQIRATRDADEVVVAPVPGGPLSVVMGSHPVPYTMAPHLTLLRPPKEVVLGGAEEKSRPHPGQTPACNLPFDRAYVRIWYVPPPHTLTSAEVDAGVKEKLRALGYDLSK